MFISIFQKHKVNSFAAVWGIVLFHFSGHLVDTRETDNK